MESPTTEKNKLLDSQYLDEILNKGNFGIIDTFLAPNYVGHISGFPSMGKEGEMGIVTMFRTAFPDLVFAMENQIAEGERVAHMMVAHGTHMGTLMGINPTGSIVEIRGLTMRRCMDGKIVESWSFIDMLGLIQKLNVVPSSGKKR
jgi:predicted ester cyclase